MFNLSNKVAIVTGGAGILGQGFCQALAEQGCNVAIVDVSYERAQQAACQIKEAVPNAELLPVVCNVAEKDSVENMVKEVVANLGGVHILLNNAATKTNNLKDLFQPFEDYDLQTWREVMAVNLDGMFLVAQAVGKAMITQGEGGSIIQTSSIYGVVAPDQSIYKGSEYLGVEINTPAVYSASKGAVLSLSKYLATYRAKHNIRVNSLTPGGIESGQKETFKMNYSRKVPLGRMGRFEELLGALLVLASDASTYVTGQNIIVDGGFTCW